MRLLVTEPKDLSLHLDSGEVRTLPARKWYPAPGDAPIPDAEYGRNETLRTLAHRGVVVIEMDGTPEATPAPVAAKTEEE